MDSGAKTGEAVCYRQTQHVLTRRILDETLLVPVHGKLADLQKVFTLNPVAEFIWEHLDGRRSLSALSSLVAGEFEVTREQAEADVREWLAQMERDGLITGGDAA